jgi:RNA polymerase sigma-70 factor (ECF subfamily)
MKDNHPFVQSASQPAIPLLHQSSALPSAPTVETSEAKKIGEDLIAAIHSADKSEEDCLELSAQLVASIVQERQQRSTSKPAKKTTSWRDRYGLTRRQRQVLHALYTAHGQQRTQSEIAKLLDVCLATIRIAVREARGALSVHNLTIEEYLKMMGILPESFAPEETKQKNLVSPTKASPDRSMTGTRLTRKRNRDKFGLTPRQQQVLQALVSPDKRKRSEKDIAALLGISQGTIHVTLHKAHQTLKAQELTVVDYLQEMGLSFATIASSPKEPRAKRGRQVIKDEFGLTQRQRDVLQARVTGEGCKRSHEEIGSLLSISVDYVRILLCKARKQLRDHNLTEKEYRKTLGLPCLNTRGKAGASARKPGRPRKEMLTAQERRPVMRKADKCRAKTKQFASDPIVHQSARDQRTDAELILAFRRGDSTAIEYLLRRCKTYIERAMHKSGVDQSEMDEVQQLVNDRIWKSLNSLRDPAKFRSWLAKITQNTWKDRLRQVVPERNSIAYSIDEPIGENDDGKREFVAGKKWQPCQQIDYEEMKQLLTEAISKIKSNHSQTCLRHRIEGYTYDEIARLTGIETGTVKSKLARSRAQLKTILLANPRRYQPDEMRTHGFIE